MKDAKISPLSAGYIIKLIKIIVFVLFAGIIIYSLFTAFLKSADVYFGESYSKKEKGIEKLYNSSQYVQKNPKAIITDDVVYAYSSWKIINGQNPVLTNPEIPPLGKYLIGLSIILFDNENIFNIAACVISLLLLFLLSYQIFKDYLYAIIPSFLFSQEKLFLSQIYRSPLLDIIQLDFLLASFILFNVAILRKKDSFIWFAMSAFFVGCFMSTKFFVSGIVIIIAFILCTVIFHRGKLLSLLTALLIAPSILILSYSRMFFLGYSLREVLGVQKWVFLYHTGHLDIPPFAIWDLILFNRWHTWWADRRISSDPQWSIMWPILIIGSISTIISLGKNFFKKKYTELLIVVIWTILYFAFLNVGQVTTRYFTILIPLLYIIVTFGIVELLIRPILLKAKKILILLLFLVLIPASAYAQESDYVLPYPGVMPGNKLYKPLEIFDQLKKYYSFGDFAQFKYNLSQADKYLVEAKILFEYKQYLLALDSLEKSDSYLEEVYPSLAKAYKSGKNISEKKAIFQNAARKHIGELKKIKQDTPKDFIWADEKKSPKKLYIWQEVDQAIKKRSKNYE